MSAASLDLQQVMDGLSRLASAVQIQPLSQAKLRERWGNPDERTFQRWLKELRMFVSTMKEVQAICLGKGVAA